MRLPHGLGPAVGRVEIDVLAVVFDGFVGPLGLDGFDALVEQRIASLRVRAVVAQLLDIPACTHPETNRPPEIRSMLAASFAVIMGSRWISSALPVNMLISRCAAGRRRPA